MSTDDDLDLSTRGIVGASLFSSLPAIAALLVIGVAALTLHSWALYIVITLAVIGMFVGDALLDRTGRGAARRHAHRRMMQTLDARETKVHDVARYLPIALALAAVVLLSGGAGGGAFALVAGYAVAQLAFAIWLHGRRDEFSPAPRS